MINFTRLLGGTPTISSALTKVNSKKRRPSFLSNNVLSPLVIFNLSRKCNLNCLHCYLESSDSDYKNELSLKQIKKTIDHLSFIGVPILLFSGGEPLLHKNIFTIIKYAKAKKIRVGLSTNGTLITKKNSRKISKDKT